MPPRISSFGPAKSFPYRTHAQTSQWRSRAVERLIQRHVRTFATSGKEMPVSVDDKGPNTDTLPHVSEEAVGMSKATGGTGPDLQQGTPVQEVVKGDEKAQENLPKVMKEELKANKPFNSRSFSTSATANQSLPSDMFAKPPLMVPEGAIIAAGSTPMTEPGAPDSDSTNVVRKPGLKFQAPSLPIPNRHRLEHRYEPIVEQVTGLLIEHGKKGVAQRNLNYILSHLRSSPPPKLRPDRPLMPGHPPASHLPLNPVLYLQLAIDSVAPVLRIRAQKGAAGGGMALQIPVPLRERTRRRTAIMWILDAAKKRKNRGSGKNMFAQRVAEEVVAVVEGRSAVWDRRQTIHKVGVAARANMFYRPRKR